MAAKAAPKRAIVLSILDKLEAEYTAKISLARAIKKLERHVAKKGLDVELTKEELLGLEILDLAPAKKAPKKKAPTKKTKPKDKDPEEKPESKPKAIRMDWMTAATRALLEEPVIVKAEDLALELYLAGGGRNVPNVRANAANNVSRAKRVLIAIGAGVLSEDKTTLTVTPV